ncbi:hypothetical protein A0H81_06658 [Grifola frondosa]|uniref:Uncharacterized protein n=1 Tax=Grifola frondosa TaxID=5627 RepID=A0A1C7M887_GRIFR|nr:hypothetical protein A0H81_06658 [Grifola frondosa]
MILGICALAGYTGGTFNTYKSAVDHFSLLHQLSSEIDAATPGVGLVGNVRALDPEGGSLTVSWIVAACFQPDRPNLPSSMGDNNQPWPLHKTPEGCGGSPGSVSIWVDKSPFFVFNASDIVEDIQTGLMHTLLQTDSFTTNHSAHPNFNSKQEQSRTALYPFDSYDFGTLIEAFNVTDGPSANSPIPIYFVLVLGSVTGWKFDVNAKTVVRTPRSAYGLLMNISAYRQDATRAFAMLLYFTNWALTAGMVVIAVYGTSSKIFGGPGGEDSLPSELLLLPLSVMLAIPALRSAMPGAPDFGMYLDIIGYFINLMTADPCDKLETT